jgi:hypothetical protein
LVVVDPLCDGCDDLQFDGHRIDRARGRMNGFRMLL